VGSVPEKHLLVVYRTGRYLPVVGLTGQQLGAFFTGKASLKKVMYFFYC